MGRPSRHPPSGSRINKERTKRIAEANSLSLKLALGNPKVNYAGCTFMNRQILNSKFDQE